MMVFNGIFSNYLYVLTPYEIYLLFIHDRFVMASTEQHVSLLQVKVLTYFPAPQIMTTFFLLCPINSTPSHPQFISFFFSSLHLQVQQTMKENLVAVEENFAALDQRMKKLSK